MQKYCMEAIGEAKTLASFVKPFAAFVSQYYSQVFLSHVYITHKIETLVYFSR